MNEQLDVIWITTRAGWLILGKRLWWKAWTLSSPLTFFRPPPISTMSDPALSKKRHSTSMSSPPTTNQTSDHSRKRLKTNDDSGSIALRNSKFSPPNKPSQSTTNGKIIHAQPTNAAKNTSSSNLDESHTAVIASITQPETDSKRVIDISSDEQSDSDLSEDDEEDDDEDEDDDDEQPYASNGALTNGTDGENAVSSKENNDEAAEDEEDKDQDMVDAEEDVAEEPTFGELLRANEPDEIDVDAAFDNPESPSHPKTLQLAQSTSQKTLSVPTGTSLTTVLTQALRTNDNELLESCFRMNDGDSIRSTIDNLQSNLVSQLLQRIAERLYKRPGRAGNLMIWVQWSIVAHGGYLASQPAVVKQMASLNRVLRERAASLQPLLALKGKLDMLNAQLELRRSKQAAAREAESEEEDDEPVIYVEGEDDDDDSDEEEDATIKSPKEKIASKRQKADAKDIEFEGSEDDEEHMVNGVDADEDDEDDEDSGSDDIDEAELTDPDTADELENADVDEGESESNSSEDEEAASLGRRHH